MLSLLELVQQNQPQFQSHRALLVIGLQNDFVQSDGRLPVNLRHGFVDRIHALIPAFRDQFPNIIWVKTIYEADRLVGDSAAGESDALIVGGLIDGVESSTDDDDDDIPQDLPLPIQSKSAKHRNKALDLLKRVRRRTAQREELQTDATEAGANPPDQDEELFLRQSASAGPACLPDTPGADWIDEIKPKIEETDTIITTTHYSAFQGTSLLLILRARLVTELYICGCISNVSVLATAIDAARHGLKINVVEDCLGYRKRSRHRLALRRMEEFFDANILTSEEVLNPREDDEEEEGEEYDEDLARNTLAQEEQKLQSLVDKLRLSDPSSGDIARNGQPKPSPDPATESGASVSTQPHEDNEDERFAEKLVQGAKVPSADQNKPAASRNSLVKTKIRMRTRSDKSKKEDDKKKLMQGSSKDVEDTKSEDSPHHSTARKNPGATLVTRFQRTGSINDLNRAVEVADMAIDATPKDHPDRANCLNSLTKWLGIRFKKTRSIDDLNRAVKVADIAVNATPPNYPN